MTDIVDWLRSILHNDRSVELHCREAADEIERLRKERDEMHRDLRKAETECSMLRIECGVITAERDEARREICQFRSTSYPHDMKEVYEIADSRGWDCFKDIDNA
jgi:uncharacterized coiled-coil DUF342 family protein